jgi:hypothetical protein
MLIVEPVLTLIALYHELVHVLARMRFLAMTIRIEIVLVVVVSHILIVFLIHKQLACLWHPTIAAIASKVQLRIQFYDIVSLMTVKHAPDAKTVRLEVLHELSIVW